MCFALQDVSQGMELLADLEMVAIFEKAETRTNNHFAVAASRMIPYINSVLCLLT